MISCLKDDYVSSMRADLAAYKAEDLCSEGPRRTLPIWCVESKVVCIEDYPSEIASRDLLFAFVLQAARMARDVHRHENHDDAIVGFFGWTNKLEPDQQQRDSKASLVSTKEATLRTEQARTEAKN